MKRGTMRRNATAVAALAACLAMLVASVSSPAGATRRETSNDGAPVVIEEGKTYAGTFPNFVSRAGLNQNLVRAPEPSQCDAAPWCDTIPIKIIEPEASIAGGHFSVKLVLTWKNLNSELFLAIFDNAQVTEASRRPPTEPGWEPQNYDPQRVARPHTFITSGLRGPADPTKKTQIIELNTRDDPLTLEDYNLLVLYMNGTSFTNYSLEGSMTIEPPESLPGEVLDPDPVPIPFSPDAFTPVPEVLASPVEEAAGLVAPLAPALPAPSVLTTTQVETLPAPADDGPATLGTVDAALDPFLQSIKQRSLEDELAAPPLRVAVSDEKPPRPPKGLVVLISALALPALGLFSIGGFMLRRRAAFRVT